MPTSQSASQPAASWTGPLLVDTGLHLVGALIVLAWAAWLWRSGAWRNPLAHVRPRPESGPGFEFVFLAIVVLYAGLSLCAALLPYDAERAQVAGTADFHRFQVCEMGAYVLLAAYAILVLRFRPTFAKGGLRASPGQLILLAFAAALFIGPICGVQQILSNTVWKWFDPTVRPPEHAVLEAFHHSAWDGWGQVQLFVSAVVLAPLAEELFFRGLVLQSLFHHLRLAWPAVIISSVAFGFVHIAQPQAVLPLATLGLVLAYLRMRYRSLALCVGVHMLFNLRTMVLVLAGA